MTDDDVDASLTRALQARERSLQGPAVSWMGLLFEAHMADSIAARTVRDAFYAHALCGMFWALREFCDRKPCGHMSCTFLLPPKMRQKGSARWRRS